MLHKCMNLFFVKLVRVQNSFFKTPKIKHSVIGVQSENRHL